MSFKRLAQSDLTDYPRYRAHEQGVQAAAKRAGLHWRRTLKRARKQGRYGATSRYRNGTCGYALRSQCK